MLREVYGVHLSVQEKGRLKKMIRAGRSSAQAATRARILLKTDEGWTAARVAAAFDVAERTVRRVKGRYVEEELEEVLRHHNSPTPHCKVDDKVEAHLIALACSPAPEGHDHWTLRLLADKTVELGLVESLSYETVRLHLKKTRSSRGASSPPVADASPRYAPSSWPTWRTSWICTLNPTIPNGRWSALTRLSPRCWPKPGSPYQPSLGVPDDRATST